MIEGDAVRPWPRHLRLVAERQYVPIQMCSISVMKPECSVVQVRV